MPLFIRTRPGGVSLAEICTTFHGWPPNGKTAPKLLPGVLRKLVTDPAFKRRLALAPGGIFTAVRGNNADLMARVATLYFQPGHKIADVTFGKGVFWRRIELSNFAFFPSDLLTCPEAPYDFRHLPYADGEFDIHVFDPPYAHNPGRMLVNDNYKNRETTQGCYHADIIKRYHDGMREGLRILRPRGLMLVKCQDEIESSKQKMSHIEIQDIAIKELGMVVQDLFVLLQKRKPVIQHKNQKHARKNHSYLWVFRKKPASPTS